MSPELEKLYVDLPGHWYGSGESIWAKKLGPDEYQIDNVPFLAYGLNYGDVVRTITATQGEKPIVSAVIRPSGHQTFRIIFQESTEKPEQDRVIEQLQLMGVTAERAFKNYVALDVPPNIDPCSVRDVLDGFNNSGVLEYETCEVRVPGSFGGDDD